MVSVLIFKDVTAFTLMIMIRVATLGLYWLYILNDLLPNTLLSHQLFTLGHCFPHEKPAGIVTSTL